MVFLNSGFIWVSALGIIPILIHFWNKKMVLQKAWSVLRFFPKSEHKKQNRINFHELLLLVLRLLVIGIATIWLMKPAKFISINVNEKSQETGENYLTYIQQFVESESSDFETPKVYELPKQNSDFPFQIQQRETRFDTLILSGNLPKTLGKAFEYLAKLNEFELRISELETGLNAKYGFFKLDFVEHESVIKNENQTISSQNFELTKLDKKIDWNPPFGLPVWKDENQNALIVQVDSVWYLPNSLLKESYLNEHPLVAYYFAKEVILALGIGENTPILVRENQTKIQLPKKVETFNELIISLFFISLAIERVLSSRRDA